MSEVIITLKPGADAEKARRELEARGLKSPQLLEAIGVVTGDADEAAAESLRSVDGVAAVEKGQTVQLPPPDSPLQ